MRDGRLLGAGGHAEGPQEDGDERGELLDVLLLALHHAEHDAVALAHALRVIRPDVLVDDLFPAPAAEPAAEEALHLWGPAAACVRVSSASLNGHRTTVTSASLAPSSPQTHIQSTPVPVYSTYMYTANPG